MARQLKSALFRNTLEIQLFNFSAVSDTLADDKDLLIFGFDGTNRSLIRKKIDDASGWQEPFVELAGFAAKNVSARKAFSQS